MIRRGRTTIPDCARESVVVGGVLVLSNFTIWTFRQRGQLSHSRPVEPEPVSNCRAGSDPEFLSVLEADTLAAPGLEGLEQLPLLAPVRVQSRTLAA